MYPVMPEKTAPTKKNNERPMRSAWVSAGRRNSKKKTRTAKIAKVRNWRFKYAEAPSWIANAIFFMLSVPSSAANTWRTKSAATPSAANAIKATITTVV